MRQTSSRCNSRRGDRASDQALVSGPGKGGAHSPDPSDRAVWRVPPESGDPTVARSRTESRRVSRRSGKERLGSGRPTMPSPDSRGGPCAARTRRWCRAASRSKIDLADRAPERFAAEVQPIERRAGQKLVQAGLPGRAEAVEFIHSYHYHRVAAMHRHPLRLTRGGEPDDLAETRLGFPQLPAGKRRPSRGTCRSFRHSARPSD